MNDSPRDIVNVFISHKHEDAQVAKDIKEKLSVYSGDRANFFLSEEIPPGDQWFQWIESHLAQSNLLFLLFTNPTADWDWCLYEAGMFTRIGGESERRVVCLCNPEAEPPAQLKHLQAVKTTLDEMKEFLRLFFGSTVLTAVKTPINERLANNDNELTSAASEMCNLLAPRIPQWRYYTNYLLLNVQDPSLITGDRIPDNARIESTRRESMAMFGLQEKPPDREKWAWAELEARAQRPEDKEWVEDLAKAIHAASQGHTVESIGGLFVALDSGKSYRPVLHRLDLEPDGSMGFTVIFVEQPEGP